MLLILRNFFKVFVTLNIEYIIKKQVNFDRFPAIFSIDRLFEYEIGPIDFINLSPLN